MTLELNEPKFTRCAYTNGAGKLSSRRWKISFGTPGPQPRSVGSRRAGRTARGFLALSSFPSSQTWRVVLRQAVFHSPSSGHRVPSSAELKPTSPPTSGAERCSFSLNAPNILTPSRPPWTARYLRHSFCTAGCQRSNAPPSSRNWRHCRPTRRGSCWPPANSWERVSTTRQIPARHRAQRYERCPWVWPGLHIKHGWCGSCPLVGCDPTGGGGNSSCGTLRRAWYRWPTIRCCGVTATVEWS